MKIIGLDGCAAIEGPTVVIDVIRAYTVAAWVFERGAREIVLSNDEEEALRVRDELGGIAINDGLPDGRFDLVNSPDFVSAADLAGRTVVLRTTAGTAGAIASRHAPVLFCTGFTTAGATVRALRRLGIDDVTMVATGGEDDVACAEYMGELLAGHEVDPGSFVAAAAASPIADALRQYVRDGNLAVGPRDIDLALEVDRFDFAMRATDQDGRLVLVRSDQPAPPGAEQH